MGAASIVQLTAPTAATIVASHAKRATTTKQLTALLAQRGAPFALIPHLANIAAIRQIARAARQNITTLRNIRTACRLTIVQLSVNYATVARNTQLAASACRVIT